MPSNFKQIDFSKGILANLDSTKIPEGGYYLGINVRNRQNTLAPIRAPLNLNGPLGTYQGLYSVGPFLVMFVDGVPYSRDVRIENAQWQRVGDVTMSSSVQDIDATLIPTSSMNYTRKYTGVDIEETRYVLPLVKGSPTGLLVQDGVTQSILISTTVNGVSGYRTQNFAQWIVDPLDSTEISRIGTQQEYVPIGRFPIVASRKSYCVGKDEAGHLNLVFQSVSGRPLDYVVNINPENVIPPDKISDRLAYTIDLEIVEPPASGQINSNANTEITTTKVWISKTASGGADVSSIIMSAAALDTMTLQQAAEATRWVEYRITGTPVDKGTYIEIPVQYLSAGFTLQAASCWVQFTFSSKTDSTLLPTPGDKGGDATTTAESFSFDDATALFQSSTSQGEFVLCTLSATYLIIPRLDRLIFGEPTFMSTFLFNSGAVNNRSFCEVLGAITYVGQKGINKFDSVTQLQVESNNIPFARPISRFMSRDLQMRTCAIRHDDYAFYSIDTIYGPAVAVYDMTNESWNSLDMYRGVSKIIQFAETIELGVRRLFAITIDNQVYEMFAGADHETPKIYIGDINSGDAAIGETVSHFSMVFGNVYEPFNVNVIHYRDHRIAFEDLHSVTAAESEAPEEPISVPFANPQDRTYKQVISTSPGSVPSITAGFMVEWSTGAEMVLASAGISESVLLDEKVSSLAKVKSTKTFDRQRYAFIADMSPIAPVTLANGKESLAYVEIIKNIVDSKIKTVIGGGDYLYKPYADTIPCYWPADIRFIFAAGEHDLDHYEEFYWNFGGKRYYRTLVSDLLDVFVINCGFNSADISSGAAPSLEPDGIEIDSVQMKWLRSELANSEARFKVVVLHIPPFSSTINSRGLFQMPYRAWGASLVLSGHAHNYERLSVGGLTYIISGTGGHSLVDFGDTPSIHSSYRRKDYGHVELVVDEFQLVTEFVRWDGQRFDAFRIGT